MFGPVQLSLGGGGEIDDLSAQDEGTSVVSPKRKVGTRMHRGVLWGLVKDRV